MGSLNFSRRIPVDVVAYARAKLGTPRRRCSVQKPKRDVVPLPMTAGSPTRVASAWNSRRKSHIHAALRPSAGELSHPRGIRAPVPTHL